ncbi:cupin domain-containing protein [Sphingosinicella rhizophila]|uniref:Cupin domain-containing protein n=1 Tax=Sphingosinicella rhizophila TaxID=3050082 RepID=A0ABU3Q277_9SPHN|nr:cupin domain-containing protein [Sphingosinicella sp. GR2756]MDT9597479.1 cupin domain-containing protein [Sphingosinicella sp. GR2756]
MPPQIIHIAEKLATFSDHWNPRIVGDYNGNELRVAKVKGEFTWHSHADTDEMFMVVSGALDIEFRDGIRHLENGDILVVPKGVEHRPVAREECEILLLDRDGEPNTGGALSEYTRSKLETI